MVSMTNSSGEGQWGTSEVSSWWTFWVHSLCKSFSWEHRVVPNASAISPGEALCTKQWLLGIISCVGHSMAFKAIVVWVHDGNKDRALPKVETAATLSMETGRFNGQEK